MKNTDIDIEALKILKKIKSIKKPKEINKRLNRL